MPVTPRVASPRYTAPGYSSWSPVAAGRGAAVRPSLPEPFRTVRPTPDPVASSSLIGSAVSVERRLADAQRIVDPLERLRRLHEVVRPEAEALLSAVMDARSLAAAEANDAGVSQGRIAATLGLSHPMGQKLVRSGQAVREERGRKYQ